MALSRLTTWSAGQLLTASALNNEFDNILNNPLSLISTASVAAKGLLLVGNGSALTGVSVGTDNQVLTADSTQASGVKWTGSANAQTPWATNINAAGYTLYGNSTSGGNLTLDSTSSGMKGSVLLNPSGGKIGLGTSSPQRLFHLSSTSVMPYIEFDYTTQATKGYVYGKGTDLVLSGNIDDDGVFSNTSATAARIAVTAVSGDSWITFSTSPTNNTAPTERLRIDKNGQVGIGLLPTVQFELSGSVGQKASGTTWSNPSDRRLKDHITPFTDGLAVLTHIKPVSYTLNGLGGTPKGQKGISVIAQDILPVAPYTIDTYKAKLHPEDAQETDLYRFEASALTFVAINAIKELDARLTALESRNT